MRYIDLIDTLSIVVRSRKRIQGITLVELLLVVVILGTLGAIAVPTYGNYIDKARNSSAIADMRVIEMGIARFRAERGRLPDTLAEAAIQTGLDPWGNPYQYLRLQGVEKKDLEGDWRRDRFTNPLNTDFDLYSMGKDGDSEPALTAKKSHDDIVRANNGAFIGLGSEY